MQHNQYFTETQASEIKKRNEQLITKRARKKIQLRHRLEDIKLANELNLSLEDIK